MRKAKNSKNTNNRNRHFECFILEIALTVDNILMNDISASQKVRFWSPRPPKNCLRIILRISGLFANDQNIIPYIFGFKEIDEAGLSR